MTPLKRQSGSTLVVALIMLVLLTLFATSSFNTAKTNLMVVGNMQATTEATNVASQALETVISTTQFITTPSNAVINPCQGTPNTICTDINGDGVTDYTSTLTPQPQCVTVTPIYNSELVLTSASSEDVGCSAGQAQTFGVQGTASGVSLCSRTIWEITVETVGATTGSKATVVQGIGIKVSNDDASC